MIVVSELIKDSLNAFRLEFCLHYLCIYGYINHEIRVEKCYVIHFDYINCTFKIKDFDICI